MKFSVLMSVYKKEDPKFLQEAIDSVLNQSFKPAEFVIMEDGPLTEDLYKVLDHAVGKYPYIIKRHALEVNMGLGLALRRGVELCKYGWIARMDSDDISERNRFDKQLRCLKNNPDLDIIGSNIIEFIGSKDNAVSTRIMPSSQNDIKKFSRRRNPFAHPSVMFRKSKIIEAGNYRHYPFCEDYDLWTRVIANNGKSMNIQETLLYMRTDENFYNRRGGFNYLKSILKLKTSLLTGKYITLTDYVVSAGGSILTSLTPPFVRVFIYKNILRGKA